MSAWQKQATLVDQRAGDSEFKHQAVILWKLTIRVSSLAGSGSSTAVELLDTCEE